MDKENTEITFSCRNCEKKFTLKSNRKSHEKICERVASRSC